MILVDTTVWLDHLRHGDPFLADLLDRGQVRGHPFVVGELAAASLRQRDTLPVLIAAQGAVTESPGGGSQATAPTTNVSGELTWKTSCMHWTPCCSS